MVIEIKEVYAMKNFFFPRPEERTIGKLIRNFLIIFFGFGLLMTISILVQIPMGILSILFGLGGLVVAGFWFWTIIQVIKRFMKKTYQEESSADQKFFLNFTKISMGVGIFFLIFIIIMVVNVITKIM